MNVVSDLKRITRWLEADLEGGPAFTALATGDFGTNTEAAVQGTTADYIVVISNASKGHTLTLNPRAPTEPIDLFLGEEGVLNVPTSPFTSVALDSTDSSVVWFFSDVPLFLGQPSSGGLPP
jgi:hypothetical protein